MAKGVPHYTKDGKLYKGEMHKDASGKLMTGKTHTSKSEFLYHTKPKAKAKVTKKVNK
jgi:hypothetical protein